MKEKGMNVQPGRSRSGRAAAGARAAGTAQGRAGCHVMSVSGALTSYSWLPAKRIERGMGRGRSGGGGEGQGLAYGGDEEGDRDGLLGARHLGYRGIYFLFLSSEWFGRKRRRKRRTGKATTKAARRSVVLVAYR